MHPLLTLEQNGEQFKLIAKDYIPRNTCLGIVHIKLEYETLKTAAGEYLQDSNFPNCMLLVEPQYNTLWTTKSVFIGDTLSIDYRLYDRHI